ATSTGAALVVAPHGVGDGSTTFNLPDMRGRAPYGRDDMGGSAASRITSAISSIAGTRVGGSGGDQRSQAHTHTVSNPPFVGSLSAGAFPNATINVAGSGDTW